MKINNGSTMALLIVLSVVFALTGMYGVLRYQAAKAQETSIRLLQHELQKADAIPDDSAAVAEYKKLHPALPEIQLRILQRQWRIALEQLQYLRRAQGNVELQNETGIYSSRLKSLLAEMLDRCSGMLTDSASLRPEVVWQLYNAAGTARVLNAFVMLENGQSVDKVQGVMRDALSDFKAAIEAVDKAGLPPVRKNIPRWNFELLNGEEFVRRFEVAMTDMEKNQVLKENLETLLPEMGGYAPGEPIETIIRK